MQNPVALRPLGSTGLMCSPLTFGTSSLGRGTRRGDEAERAAVELARALLTGPFSLVDTSNAYAEGRSEEVLGLARRAVPRAELAPDRSIVTKTDRDLATGIFDRDRVLRSFEESCRRLGVDRVPLVHLHDPYTVTFEEASGPRGAIAGMVELKERGLVDAIGIAAGRISVVQDYVRTGVFDALLTHNRYTIVDQSAEPLIREAHQRGMAVFNAAPFGGGLLASGVASKRHYAYQTSSPELLSWVRRVELLCVEHDVTLPRVALQFSLRSEFIHSTVVGVSSTIRMAALEELRRSYVPDDFWGALDRLGPAPSPLTD
ncbi:D-threo-aldose 1-dehydrogenase [Bogoriella caseilytica]|uniref:D-threo-aldose 1-dehydrogenase n=2 Tax=Bogoriella caseilytica TaxID=56055 RepID=A0A3N2BAX2_9MICO|nr:D-threo-aldose 1-dehydrogenase [Bogoriella caseilytica]